MKLTLGSAWLCALAGLEATGRPQLVEGHPAQLIEKYNSMIGNSNRLRY
jgi:hypothetical protein